LIAGAPAGVPAVQPLTRAALARRLCRVPACRPTPTRGKPTAGNCRPVSTFHHANTPRTHH